MAEENDTNSIETTLESSGDITVDKIHMLSVAAVNLSASVKDCYDAKTFSSDITDVVVALNAIGKMIIKLTEQHE